MLGKIQDLNNRIVFDIICTFTYILSFLQCFQSDGQCFYSEKTNDFIHLEQTNLKLNGLDLVRHGLVIIKPIYIYICVYDSTFVDHKRFQRSLSTFEPHNGFYLYRPQTTVPNLNIHLHNRTAGAKRKKLHMPFVMTHYMDVEVFWQDCFLCNTWQNWSNGTDALQKRPLELTEE